MAKDDLPQYLSTAEAARVLAVSVSTVKRWVDDEILPAHLTAGGHRKLLRSEVLALIRQGGLTRGEPAPLAVSGKRKNIRDTAAIASALFDALLGGQAQLASSLIRSAYQSGLPVEALADQVVSPAMADVGHHWQTARIDIWHEHRGTRICAAALNDLRRDLEPRAEKHRPVAVGAAPEGDPYSLPTQLAQLVLLDNGWQAVDLGPNTPLASLIKAVQELRPRIVWLSVSRVVDVDQFLTGSRELFRVAEQEGAALAVGGPALVDSLRASMSYTTYGDGMTHLASFARSLHPRPRRPRPGRPRNNSR